VRRRERVGVFPNVDVDVVVVVDENFLRSGDWHAGEGRLHREAEEAVS